MSGFVVCVFAVVVMLVILFVVEPLLWRLTDAMFGKGYGFLFTFILGLHFMARTARIAILILAPVIGVAYLFGQSH